ncbi:VOC family protein [Thermaerobacillus caldiproteolyticus]|uniref:hypothetical protein n=1 Tax=Thermaerobacillus caldiproteolyticus TaxID=247480 RepID=UPI0035A9A029
MIECEDIERTYEMMRANGVKFPGELKQMPWEAFVMFLLWKGKALSKGKVLFFTKNINNILRKVVV